MPLVYFSRIFENRTEFYFAEMHRRNSQGDAASSTLIEGESTSSLANFKLEYAKLPDRIKSFLDYCCLITFRYSTTKDKLVRLLLAEGLVPEKQGEAMESVAEVIIEDLIGLGMLVEDAWGEVEVDEDYKEVCVVEVEENEFVAQTAESPVRAIIDDDGKGIPPNFKAHQIRSLFLTTLRRRVEGSEESLSRAYMEESLSRAYMESICKMQSLVVLDLHGQIECLPDGVGNLVNLRYLGLFSSGVDELPPTFINLKKLQSLDLRSCGLGYSHELPVEVLSIKQLRHLLMSHNTNDCEIKVPKGFGAMENLQTCDGVYAGGGIASELGNLILLRKLAVKRVAGDHVDELVAAIMKMTNLISLSLEAEGSIFEGTLLPEMEQFSPPPLLQELDLHGGLTEIPNWLLSMESLTTLCLSFSRLLESQTLVLQFLPKLKHLNLWDASEAKCMGKEFCEAGGFPKLETLEIASSTLVEWTEIVEGAFPNLRSLSFRNCVKLKFLPEGLQYILKLERLNIVPVYNDILRRLEGEENYKIKHINVLTYFII